MADVDVVQDNSPTLKAGEVINEETANELIFAVVGPVGSGTSVIADSLSALLHEREYKVEIIKASDSIRVWADANSVEILDENILERVVSFQDAGDKLREHDVAGVARFLAVEVRNARSRLQGESEEVTTGAAVVPDGEKRAYILDSLKHPAEVSLLRNLYQDAFCLIGVGCDSGIRVDRMLNGKFRDSSKSEIIKLSERDEKDELKHGQRVSDTFHLSDFFIDNSPSRFVQDNADSDMANPEWDIPERLGRLVDILTHQKVVRPDPAEIGMYYAHGARMRSACLSRQVGASLVDGEGNVVATGTNEVPKAGGGVYGSGFGFREFDTSSDFRCSVCKGYCSNTRTQNEIIEEIIESIPELADSSDKDLVRKTLRSTPVGQLIEFSRAVHAEMDALLSAARQGISTLGCRLFVTTYPCHNCARNIVASGVDEVQFIEPYLKSRALALHADSITDQATDWEAPSEMRLRHKMGDEYDNDHPKVLFRPFSGVAPSLFRRAFLKDRDLKNSQTGSFEIGTSDSAIRPEPLRSSYAEVEARLSKDLT